MGRNGASGHGIGWKSCDRLADHRSGLIAPAVCCSDTPSPCSAWACADGCQRGRPAVPRRRRLLHPLRPCPGGARTGPAAPSVEPARQGCSLRRAFPAGVHPFLRRPGHPLRRLRPALPLDDAPSACCCRRLTSSPASSSSPGSSPATSTSPAAGPKKGDITLFLDFDVPLHVASPPCHAPPGPLKRGRSTTC